MLTAPLSGDRVGSCDMSTLSVESSVTAPLDDVSVQRTSLHTRECLNKAKAHMQKGQ